MATGGSFAVTDTVLDAPHIRELAAFYWRLPSRKVIAEHPDRVRPSAPGGGPGLVFQTE